MLGWFTKNRSWGVALNTSNHFTQCHANSNGNLYKPVAYEIVDLYGLDCDMKFEFNSDNKRLYEQRRILMKERV